MIRREANFQTLFRHWVKKNGPASSAVFELKQTTTDSIPFSAVQDHQLAALNAAREPGILYKIPDDSRGVKPFDMVYLRHAERYIVIRYPDFFCIIDVYMWELEEKKNERKSLTSKRAREIADRVIELN